MKHLDLADLALTELRTRLASSPLAACWETFVTATLAQALLERGFTLQMGAGRECGEAMAHFVSWDSQKVQVKREARSVWLHDSSDVGSTDLCVVHPSIAHFEIKTGASVGPKTQYNPRTIADDFRRALVTSGYDCIIFLLVAHKSFYEKATTGGNYDSMNAAVRSSIAKFLPEVSKFSDEIKEAESTWEGIDVVQRFLRINSSGLEDHYLLACLRKSHRDHCFTP